MEWLKHHKLLAVGGLIGLFVVVKVAKNAGASQAADQSTYNGPSVIGAPGPVVSTAPGSDSSALAATTAGGTVDWGQYIQGEVAKATAAANVANTASATTTNVDLIEKMLTKVGQGGLQNNQIALNYNETGQLTSVEKIKALDPLTAVQSAKSAATVSSIQNQQAAATAKSLAQQAIDAINANTRQAIAAVKSAATIQTTTQKIQNQVKVTTARQANDLQTQLNKIIPVKPKAVGA